MRVCSPDIGTIVQSLIEGGVEAMKKNCKLRVGDLTPLTVDNEERMKMTRRLSCLQVGMPIKPMLAKICA